jgi:hypothetical protein
VLSCRNGSKAVGRMALRSELPDAAREDRYFGLRIVVEGP